MKILEIPAYFYPEQVASSYLWKDLTEAYAKVGFHRVIYCPVPSRGCSEDIKREYRNRKEEFLYNNTMHIIRFFLFQEGKSPIMRAFRYMLSAVIQFWYGAFGRHSKDCDIVMVNSTPPHSRCFGCFYKKKETYSFYI